MSHLIVKTVAGVIYYVVYYMEVLTYIIRAYTYKYKL